MDWDVGINAPFCNVEERLISFVGVSVIKNMRPIVGFKGKDEFLQMMISGVLNIMNVFNCLI